MRNIFLRVIVGRANLLVSRAFTTRPAARREPRQGPRPPRLPKLGVRRGSVEPRLWFLFAYFLFSQRESKFAGLVSFVLYLVPMKRPKREGRD